MKAIFLLLIFSLNIVVGFACPVGIYMGSNTSHHEPTKLASIKARPEHPANHDLSKHPTKLTTPSADHHLKHGDTLQQETKHEHSGNNKEECCCTDYVYKIFETSKSVPKAAKLIVSSFHTTFANSWFERGVSYTVTLSSFRKYFVRGHHPPIADIRIAIRSFQI